jgi:hypothetical protein
MPERHAQHERSVCVDKDHERPLVSVSQPRDEVLFLAGDQWRRDHAPTLAAPRARVITHPRITRVIVTQA